MDAFAVPSGGGGEEVRHDGEEIVFIAGEKIPIMMQQGMRGAVIHQSSVDGTPHVILYQSFPIQQQNFQSVCGNSNQGFVNSNRVSGQNFQQQQGEPEKEMRRNRSDAIDNTEDSGFQDVKDEEEASLGEQPSSSSLLVHNTTINLESDEDNENNRTESSSRRRQDTRRRSVLNKTYAIIEIKDDEDEKETETPKEQAITYPEESPSEPILPIRTHSTSHEIALVDDETKKRSGESQMQMQQVQSSTVLSSQRQPFNIESKRLDPKTIEVITIFDDDAESKSDECRPSSHGMEEGPELPILKPDEPNGSISVKSLRLIQSPLRTEEETFNACIQNPETVKATKHNVLKTLSVKPRTLTQQLVGVPSCFSPISFNLSSLSTDNKGCNNENNNGVVESEITLAKLLEQPPVAVTQAYVSGYTSSSRICSRRRPRKEKHQLRTCQAWIPTSRSEDVASIQSRPLVEIYTCDGHQIPFPPVEFVVPTTTSSLQENSNETEQHVLEVGATWKMCMDCNVVIDSSRILVTSSQGCQHKNTQELNQKDKFSVCKYCGQLMKQGMVRLHMSKNHSSSKSRKRMQVVVQRIQPKKTKDAA